MDSAAPSPERIEVSCMKLVNGKIVHETLRDAEVSTLIEQIQKEEEAAQKLAEASSGDI